MNELTNHLNSLGFYPLNISKFGELVRFKRNPNEKKKDAWIVVFENQTKSGEYYYVAEFGDWKTNEVYKYNSCSKHIDEKELKQIKESIAARQKLIQESAEAKRQRAKSLAQSIYNTKTDHETHPYLTKKQIPLLGSKHAKAFICSEGLLRIPCLDKNKEIVGLQTISESGKKFLSGQQSKGTFFQIDAATNDDITYICEGYATGCSIHLATGKKVICAFGVNNIKDAILSLRLEKKSNIIVCADNDQFTEGNPGLKEAKKISDSFGHEYVYPSFKNLDSKPTDFNDLHLLEGIDSVRSTITIKDKKEIVTVKDDAYYASKYKHYNDGFHYIIYTERSEKIVSDYLGFAKFIHEKYNLIINNRYTYIYKDNYYQLLNDPALLDNLILKYTKEKVEPRDINSFVKMIKTYSTDFLSDPPGGFINLNNGVYDIKNLELINHCPSYKFVYKIGIDFDQKAKCNTWLKFLNQVMMGDQSLIDILQEMFGYVLLGGKPFLHRIFVLMGEGRNGKSTVLDILKQMIGETNYSSVSISMLDKPFSAIQLHGKLANIVGELSTRVINSEVFKIAAGGEELNMSYKGKDEFSAPINARIIFATNKLPKFQDTTTGLYEKLCIIPFNYYIKKEDRDVEIVDKLSKELPGIFKWAVEGANRLMYTKSLTESKAASDAVNEWRYDLDPVYRFISSIVEYKDVKSDDKVSSNDLYSNYLDFCKEEHITDFYGKTGFMRKFYENIKKLNPKIQSDRNSGQRYTTFIKLKQFTKTLSTADTNIDYKNGKVWPGYN